MEVTPETTCGPTPLAVMFSLTAMRVQQLATDGVVVRKGRGKYALIDSVRNYVAYLRSKPKNQHDGDPNTAEGKGYEFHRARLTQAKADIAEIEAELLKGQSHDAAAVAKVWGDMITNARTKLLAMPTKLAAQLEGLTIAERQDALRDAINAALSELADYRPEVVTGEYVKTHRSDQTEDDDEATA